MVASSPAWFTFPEPCPVCRTGQVDADDETVPCTHCGAGPERVAPARAARHREETENWRARATAAARQREYDRLQCYRNPDGQNARAVLGEEEWRKRMTTDLAIRDQEMTQIVKAGFDDEQKELIKAQLMPHASDGELMLFLNKCRASRLNPLKSPPEIWPVPFKKNTGTRERPQWTTVYAPVTGVDGYRMMARRSDVYDGQIGPFWCGPDGEWKDVWLEKTPPAAAKVGVRIKGQSEPVWGIAVWAEHEQYAAKNPKYKEMPSHMLAIRAECQAIRKAFPNVTEGMEMSEEVRMLPEPEAQQTALTGTTAEALPEEASPMDADYEQEDDGFELQPEPTPEPGQEPLDRKAVTRAIQLLAARLGWQASDFKSFLEDQYGAQNLAGVPDGVLVDIRARLEGYLTEGEAGAEG